MDSQERRSQRELAVALRRRGRTWVEIQQVVQARWPQLPPLPAMRVAHGWTQRQAADAWNDLWPDKPKTDKEIASMESRRPGFMVLSRLAQLYQCKVSDLVTNVGDFAHLDANASSTSESCSPVAATVEVEAGQSDRSPGVREDFMKRRGFIVGGVAASALAAVDVADSVRPLDGIRFVNRGLRRLDGAVSSGLLIEPVTAHLRMVGRLVSSRRDVPAREAAGSLSVSAREATESRHRRGGVDLAERAVARVDPDAPPAATAWVSTMRAVAHAGCGERYRAQAALDRAREVLQSREVEAEHPWPWIYRFGESKIAGYRLRCAVLLGDWASATAAAARADEALSRRNRQAVLLRLDLAEAHLGAGAADEGLALAAEALGSPRARRSKRVLNRAMSIEQRAAELGAPIAGSELEHRLRALEAEVA